MKSNRWTAALAVLSLSSIGAAMLQAQVLAAPPEQGSATSATRSATQPSPPARLQEDWSIPAVNRAALQPISSAGIGTKEQPEFTREVIRVQWRPGDPIDLFVVKPRNMANPRAILYLYGYPNDTERFWDDGWCRRATLGGFAAVGFVSALTGQRYTNRPMKEWFVSQLQESLGTSTHDVQMILDYLSRRGDLSANQVGMFGQGSGATIALLAASVDPRIAFVDVLDPWGDWPDWFATSAEVPDEERAAYLRPDFLKSIENLDPVHVLPSLKLKSLRLQQVMEEPVTPAKAKAALSDAGRTSGQIVDYRNEREHLDAWRVGGLSGWLREHMRDQELAQPNFVPSPEVHAGPGSAPASVHAPPAPSSVVSSPLRP